MTVLQTAGRGLLASPVALALLGSLLVGSIILIGAGGNPIEAYAAIVAGAFGGPSQ